MTHGLTINGGAASAEAVAEALLNGYATFTSMQVEAGAVRGLDLHIARLRDAANTLFGAAPSEARLRDCMRATLEGETGRVSLRVQLYLPSVTPRRPDPRGVPDVLVRVSEPLSPIRGNLRLGLVDYQREAPSLKHVALFGALQAARQVRQAGFDEALFVDTDGHISEGSIWSLGLVQQGRIVWPKAARLASTGQALLSRGLELVGLDEVSRPVRVDELGQFDHGFIVNSATPACPVQSIGAHEMADNPGLIDQLQAAWASNAPQLI